MSFGAPQWFWALLLIPLLIALFFNAEHRGMKRLQEFVSARLLPLLAGTVNRPRRIIRFGLQLFGLALAVISLAQPRWGYTFEDVKRKGLDLLIAVDTSRSMLSNDVQPNRLDRVKLAVQDLLTELQGDRVGLIAFAGRAFLQAPLTIDYDAVVQAINDLDTKTIPEGGTNISSAITLATQSFGKSATGNRGLIIFTDGEELSGDAVKTAKTAADAGVRIFTVGVGTPQGSLIPITTESGETSFVKDSAGQVVKSKLDDKRLREVAQATGGFYVHLENGPRTMQQVETEGLAKMQAAEMDVRLSRQPIERYEWPLSAALLALALSILIPERKSATGRIRRREGTRTRGYIPAPATTAGATAVVLMLFSSFAFATAPGIDAYRDGKFEEAYGEFQQALKSHPESRADDKLQFDSGAAAYKLKDYNKALESFSQALLTRDTALQGKGHYNLGNTLYQRGEAEKSDEKKLSDWTNALDHYQQTLKLDPHDKDAKDNYEYVKKKIDELKNKKSQQQPSPSPSPKQNKKQKQQKQQKQQQQDQDQDQQKQSQQNQQQQQQQQEQDNDQQKQSQQNQQQQQQQQQGQGQDEKKEQQQSQDQQSQNQASTDKDQKEQKQKQQALAKNEPQNKQKQQPSESPSPSPESQQQQGKQPSPSPGQRQAEESPTPGEGENEEASPSPGEGENETPSPGEGGDENTEPSATPAESPQKFAGEVKGAGKEQKPQDPADKKAEVADDEAEKQGQMSERQALALLESMKDEEARVQLDERKIRRHVYNDW
jgi:Ca-activated chloride channel homolog